VEALRCRIYTTSMDSKSVGLAYSRVSQELLNPPCSVVLTTVAKAGWMSSPYRRSAGCRALSGRLRYSLEPAPGDVENPAHPTHRKDFLGGGFN
jgi:hypothetical protein